MNIATSIIFAGMSGPAVADGGIGNLCYQAMVDEGLIKNSVHVLRFLHLPLVLLFHQAYQIIYNG